MFSNHSFNFMSSSLYRDLEAWAPGASFMPKNVLPLLQMCGRAFPLTRMFGRLVMYPAFCEYSSIDMECTNICP